jgi:hypothetical protein
MTERAWHESEEPPDTERAWLERLAPGDQVIVHESGRDTLASVDRRLPSGGMLVSCDGDMREFNFDGRLHTSGTYSPTYLVEPTPDRKGAIERQHLARYLAEQQWHTVPLDTLRRIAELVRND